MPWKPTRMGPMRIWIRARPFRSIHVSARTITERKPKSPKGSRDVERSLLEAHLSTSPRMMSMEPRTTTASATYALRSMWRSAWRLAKDGVLTLTR